MVSFHSDADNPSEVIDHLRDEQKRGKTLPQTDEPEVLPLSAIKFAQAVFQPRVALYDGHVKGLASAIKARDGKPLDPVTVWFSGMRWYVIDGHHRLAAYELYNEGRTEGQIELVPVKIFRGSLAQAVKKAAAANSKDKLPLSQQDKSNTAWKLVCMADSSLSAVAIARAAGVSRQTVHLMKKVLGQLGDMALESAPIDMAWLDAKNLADGKPLAEWTDDRLEKMAQKMRKGIYSACGNLPTKNPEAFARALELISEEFPVSLLQTPVFREAQEELERQEEGWDGFY